jgi:hypothetical protein
MTVLIVAAVLGIVFIVSLIIQIMTTKAAPRRKFAMKRVSFAVLILGAFVLNTACSTTHKGTSAKKPVGYVKRAVFTTAIKKREPTNNIRELSNDQQKIYYFTDLRGMQGQKVKHRWTYKGKVMAEVEFKVKGPRWRAYSSKWLKRGWLGDWTVSTVDRRGRTLSRNKFSYTQAKGFFGKAGKLYDELFGED